MSRFTREAIINTFLELLKEKDLEKITVTEIVETCQINRKTFYYYFNDTLDLLEQVFGERLKSYEDEFEIPPSPEDFILNLTEYMRVNHKATMHVYNSDKDFLQNYIAQMARKVFRRFVINQLNGSYCSKADEDLMVEIMSMTFTGLVMSWFRNGISTNPEAYIKHVCAMLKNSVPFLYNNNIEYNKKNNKI